MVSSEDKSKGVEIKYHCGWCGNDFKRNVRFSQPYNEYGKTSKHGGCSDQVKCFGCGNFLSTWNDKKQ